MPAESSFRQRLWMTGTPVLRRSRSGCFLGQRVPWHVAIGGAVVYGIVLWALSRLQIPPAGLLGFRVFGGLFLLGAVIFLFWLGTRPPMVIFDAEKGLITIPRLSLTLPSAELARLELVDGTSPDGEGGRYAVVALRLVPGSFVYVTHRQRELRDAWIAFTAAVQTATGHPRPAEA